MIGRRAGRREKINITGNDVEIKEAGRVGGGKGSGGGGAA